MATLFSFRRCPYAIRARLALSVTDRVLELVEVDLKNKPERMLELSPKGTVPVLELDDGTVIDESLDIMLWTLTANDPEGWLGASDAEQSRMLAWVTENDGPFKHHLDRTKYAVRYPGADAAEHRVQAMAFIERIDAALAEQTFLFGDRPRLADWALTPFVRQFANIDRARFDREAGPRVTAWLDHGLAHPLFAGVMKKGGRWAGK